MHIKLADTALNEIFYQMVPYFSEILLFVYNYDVKFSFLNFIFFYILLLTLTIDPDDLKK
jgi:hypothetical protein